MKGNRQCKKQEKNYSDKEKLRGRDTLQESERE